MNDEVTAQIKEHAVRTIAHRWFAFLKVMSMTWRAT